MTEPMPTFEWGTLKSGFAIITGVFRTGHPRRSRTSASFVSSHGAIVEADQRLPFNTPLEFLVPARRTDRRPAEPMTAELVRASERQFAMAEFDHAGHALFRDHSGLFRSFADVRSHENILHFANRFGPLGGDASVAIAEVVPEEPWKQSLEMIWAEPLSLWQAEAKHMQEVVALRDAAGHEHEQKQAEIAALVSEGLRDRIDFALGASDGRSSLIIRPKGLIGALWLQAARAVAGNRDLKQCAECATWYEVSAEHARPDKIFCSDACRMRAYRRRKKEKEA